MQSSSKPDNTVDEYGWNSSDVPHTHGYLTPEIIKQLEQLDVNRICDIGAGNGTLCAQLREHGYELVGTEFDASGVEVARQTYTDIPFYNLGVQDSPQALLNEEQSFDAVVSTEVIEHLFAPHQLPQFAREILEPNGYLIITTPYHGYLKNLVLSVLNKWDGHFTALWHGGHIKFWSRKTLTSLLQENGFTVISFKGVGRLPLLWKSMVLVAKANTPDD